MIKVTLKDGSVLEFEAGVSVLEVARRIGKRLAKDSLVARVDGALVDLSHRLEADAAVEILTAADPAGLEVMRHSASHVMAEAILRLFPGTKLVYGPPIEDGFYYDVDSPETITEEDLPRIEKEMKRIIKRNEAFARHETDLDGARERVGANEYKHENLARAKGTTISFYGQGADFEDLCTGPHVPSTGRVGACKVLSLSGAYLHGDATQKQLTRIYGTSFPTAEDLDAYLKRLEEAKKRDHRRLGKDLDLFSTDANIGSGLILWHPNGSLVRHLVEDFWRTEHLRRGYQILYTPHIASEAIYRLSGHLENYGEMMYSPMDIDGQPYRVKPMNCPGHIMIYRTQVRSYRELPLRWCELGTVYRYEPSGTLHGMLRVRGFTQDDSHIFCTPEQVVAEINGVLDLMEHMMTTFGYTYKAFLATRPEKSIGTDAQWEMATAALREVLETRGMAYEVDEGGGVFYGPKIDIKLVDALGREWQGPTTQLDFNLPERFDMDYVGADNERHRVVMIHRTVLGSMERFVGGLIEHYGGDFPLWLAPEQVRVLTITDGQRERAEAVVAELTAAGLRVGSDLGPEKVGAKIRRCELAKIPYTAILGAREVESGTVAVRRRLKGDLGAVPQATLAERLTAEATARLLPGAVDWSDA